MAVQSNPRKLTQSGSTTVVSFPQEILEAVGLERGDRVILTAENGTVTIEEVEWRTVNNE